jgi:hypothetical protein
MTAQKATAADQTRNLRCTLKLPVFAQNERRVRKRRLLIVTKQRRKVLPGCTLIDRKERKSAIQTLKVKSVLREPTGK